MFYPPERFTDNSPMSPKYPMIVRNTSEIKSLYLFTEVFDVKKKTSVTRVCADKSKCKAVRAGTMLWSSIKNRKGNTKINEQVRNLFILML